MTRSPIYDLGRVQAAGAAGKVTLTRTAQRDYQEMGYGLADVHDSIANLQLSDYHGVAKHNGVSYDVYHPRHRGPSGHNDELYVKLSAPTQTTVAQVAVSSFHLKRKG